MASNESLGHLESVAEWEPQYDITVFYSPHEFENDVKGLEALLSDADVYLPELFGWNEKEEEVWNSVSSGEVSVDAVVPENVSGARRAQLEMIQGKDIAVAFADVHGIEDLSRRSKMEIQNFQKSVELSIKNGKLEDAITREKELTELMARTTAERERYIEERIESAVERARARYPKLRSKEKLKVVMVMGGGHLFHHRPAVREQGIKFVRSDRTTVFSHSLEYLRACMTGKVREYSSEKVDLLAARSLLEEFVEGVIDRILPDTERQDRFFRTVLGRLNMEDIKEIVVERLGSPERVFEEICRRAGVPVPKSEGDIDRVIGR